MSRLFFIVFILILAACGKEATVRMLPDPAPDQEMNYAQNGITLILDENSFDTSPSLIGTTLQNDSLRNYGYGAFYHIEIRVDGLWHMITYSDAVFLKNKRFTDSGNILLAGEKVHQQFSVEELGVTLLPGEYRLVKSFLAQGEPFHEVSVAAPFTVE
ncbi:immunoglobulin-like domain-containing protein [Sporosarcina sp. G11-34]|uniref:immunoglobulin-like domain-containing protein n=1 Tax=Sporosarcina sp. G11-34 TaxID=2849605 RepID=UPI0022A9451B|nr:immunoglobulin-like domain-containing protein [Sporosarcina sp. G11-34]MCZ2259108.1 hypothetical protein [Sporosarcina sp. G11-34]